MARTPVLDWLGANVPSVRLRAHGKSVGLPSDKDMGNSEVGHMTLGSGRVIDQDMTRIHKAFSRGELATNPAIADGCKYFR